MSRTLTHSLKLLRLLPRAMLMMLIVSAPVLAVPSVRGGEGRTIEAPAMKKTGMGLVLLVSLQRS